MSDKHLHEFLVCRCWEVVAGRAEGCTALLVPSQACGGWGHQHCNQFCGPGMRGQDLLLSHSSCSEAGCVRSSVMKSMIMQPVFLDEASCLHIESYTYKYCEFQHGFISLASNSTITANLLDIQSSQNILPGARCLAKNIPKEFQELLFSVTTFADVCIHPPSCRQLNFRTLPCQENDGNRCKSWTAPALLSFPQDGTAVPRGVLRELGCEEVVKCRCKQHMPSLHGEFGGCRADSAAARSPSRALGVCPLPLPVQGGVESLPWAGAGDSQGGGTVTAPSSVAAAVQRGQWSGHGRVHPEV